MNPVTFSAAKAVFFPALPAEPVAASQYGFYYALDLTPPEGEEGLDVGRVVIRLTARNIYRLYVNGEMTMHGPARTAHGYCRVDEVDITRIQATAPYGTASPQYSTLPYPVLLLPKLR